MNWPAELDCLSSSIIAAFRPNTEHHAACKSWLENTLNSRLPIRLFSMIEAGFLRITTHPKVFDKPSKLQEAREFLSILSSAPTVEPVIWNRNTQNRWLSLCNEYGLRGNDCNDAMLAAIAMQSRYRLVSLNVGFKRFKKLSLLNPASE